MQASVHKLSSTSDEVQATSQRANGRITICKLDDFPWDAGAPNVAFDAAARSTLGS
jgi:hypothetical protein